MANRRCISALITRHFSSLFSSSSSSRYKTLNHFLLQNSLFNSHLESRPSVLQRKLYSPHLAPLIPFSRRFSSVTKDSDKEEEEEGDEEEEDDEDQDRGGEEDEEAEDEEEGELSGGEDEDDVPESNCVVGRANLTAEKAEDAAAIGYKVIGALGPSERPFKPWEPVFAVVQIGSHQFKVSNGDTIYTERLKHCEVNDKLILSRVLLLGSKTQTIIGRPTLPDAAVHAVVEEHALDAKVIIFKKKRRKNYRRTKGHRQELTRLRITDIQGIEKPETPVKPEKSSLNPEKASIEPDKQSVTA